MRGISEHVTCSWHILEVSGLDVVKIFIQFVSVGIGSKLYKETLTREIWDEQGNRFSLLEVTEG
jgi:hypothetical protein